jgi:L-serine dehydratase
MHEADEQVYSMSTLAEILPYIEREGLTYWEYVEQCEGEGIWEYLQDMWQVMQKTINEGLQAEGVIPGGLHLRSKARQYYVRASSYKPSLQSRALVIAYALATSERNAVGSYIVTAPTCGSSGVLPAVLYHLKKSHDFTDTEILRAMATAALFANVIKNNASLSGAEVGCQGEVGSACVMAAVAANQLFGGSPQQIEYAAEMAMEHNLGLTCDPMCGLVQIPCIERNAMAALRALDINIYAMMSDGKHIISFDKVVRTMKRTGHDLPSLYKETSMGGLAVDDI